MKRALLIFLLACFAVGQDSSPAGKRVEWDPAAPNAVRELPDGRIQRTARSEKAQVSVISGVAPARRMIDPGLDGGADVTFVGIAVHNTSNQPLRIDPSTITLRAVGKKEKELKRLSEDQVAVRAWQSTSAGAPSALPAMPGGMSSGTLGDAALQTAITNKQQSRVERHETWSEQNTGLQAAKLKERALPAKDLEPGEQVVGLVFFYPYEKKDQLELSIPVGDTTFVIPFVGSKKKH